MTQTKSSPYLAAGTRVLLRGETYPDRIVHKTLCRDMLGPFNGAWYDNGLGLFKLLTSNGLDLRRMELRAPMSPAAWRNLVARAKRADLILEVEVDEPQKEGR